ncbi:MAG: hypothetical protein R6X15_11585 [Pseudomonadota bacterium]
MKKIIGMFIVLAFLNGCRASDESYALGAIGDKDLAWVFIQFNVPEEDDDSETYYLYGKISKQLLSKIADNRISQGFIFMRSDRYWGNDDTIKAYRDGENTGDLVYRIEDIRRMKVIRTEPKVGMSYEEFTNSGDDSYSEENSSSTPAENKL